MNIRNTLTVAQFLICVMFFLLLYIASAASGGCSVHAAEPEFVIHDVTFVRYQDGSAYLAWTQNQDADAVLVEDITTGQSLGGYETHNGFVNYASLPPLINTGDGVILRFYNIEEYDDPSQWTLLNTFGPFVATDKYRVFLPAY